LDVAIDAMRVLSAEGHAAHLLVVGAGLSLPSYVARSADLERVHFLGEIHDEDELAVIFAASDLVLIPGAVGLAVNHALAYGLPLVTARGQAHGPEVAIAEHGQNAWFVQTCTADDIASALSFIIQTPQVLAALRLGAAETNVPTLESMVANIADLVARVAADHAE
jgi:glycosyltransferase involved in cell wall biosynthesis